VVIAVVGFTLVVTGLGMSIFVPWARARGEHDDVASALRVNTWSNVASAVVLVAVLAWWAASGGHPVAVALIGVSLALERNVDTWLGVPVADGESAVAVVSVLVRRTVCLVVMVPALLAGADPVLAFTGGLTVGAVAGQVHVRRAVRGLEGDADRVGVRAVVSRAAPFLVANTTGQARTLDVTLVSLVGGPVAAGVYAAATKLVQPVLLVPQALASVLVPHATRLDTGTARRLGTRLGAALAGCAVLATPLVVWREEVVVLVLGEQYRGAGLTFAVALAGVGFIAWATTVGAILQGQGRQRLVARLGAVFAVLVLAGVALGAWLAGPTGAAVGLSASWAAYAFTLAIFLASPTRTNVAQDVGPAG
ncbi:MAG: lipopolysaccharide biosynthesis protein, partial [Actinomycetales bacterium]|nr:lipopolysaccharide biosynthesis protein [Actinomycetales bacterium]